MELREKSAIGMTTNSIDLKVLRLRDDLALLLHESLIQNVNVTGESSDEELGSVSPVDDLSARSGGEHSGASSSVSTTSSGVFPPSSLPGLQGRTRVRSITPNRFQSTRFRYTPYQHPLQ